MPDSDPADDLRLLIRAAKAAGVMALTYTGTTAQKWEKPEGLGPVTEADLAVDAMLHDCLLYTSPSPRDRG